MTVRAQRRLRTMRQVQEVALEAFEQRGFDAVSVEEIAQRAEVGTATVYRHFGTKERLVLWDAYDPMLFEGIAARLKGGDAPFQAMAGAVCDALGSFYERDKRLVLRRTDLAWRTPALRTAALTDLNDLREGLCRVLKPEVTDAFERDLMAAVFVTMLDRCIDDWRKNRARTPLATIVRRAAKVVAKLG
jgi:AcrR family transcriptional regulator